MRFNLLISLLRIPPAALHGIKLFNAFPFEQMAAVISQRLAAIS
jgi:hypothetical protein